MLNDITNSFCNEVDLAVLHPAYLSFYQEEYLEPVKVAKSLLDKENM